MTIFVDFTIIKGTGNYFFQVLQHQGSGLKDQRPNGRFH